VYHESSKSQMNSSSKPHAAAQQHQQQKHQRLAVLAFGLAWAALSCRMFAQQWWSVAAPGVRFSKGTSSQDSGIIISGDPREQQRHQHLLLRLPSPYQKDHYDSSPQEEVALRAVILSDGTRVQSLTRLLYSLCVLVSEGDRIDVDVWLDVPPGATATGAIAVRRELARDVEQLAANGTYRHGRIRAHVWEHHVGLRGQWLEAWHRSIPGGLTDATSEIGLILEDDLELSPFAWRWLKAAYAAYGEDRRVAGFSLQRLELCAARCDDLKGGPNGAGGGFFYPVLGTWGFSPRAQSFASFRHWYYRLPADFKPYVDGISPTDWYMEREKVGSVERMWSMHHIYYTETHEDRYTVYVKCPENYTLAVNHLEVGLNYEVKDEPRFKALATWDPELVNFSKDPRVLNYSGAVVASSGG
jgi:hypothetical protein